MLFYGYSFPLDLPLPNMTLRRESYRNMRVQEQFKLVGGSLTHTVRISIAFLSIEIFKPRPLQKVKEPIANISIILTITMEKENIFNFKAVDTTVIKDLTSKVDPYIFAIYIEYYENCLRVVFNNGIDIDLPYPPGMDSEKAFPINDIYYRRN